ncbi:MAG TPA: hypothetical protein VG228_05100 [Solirubrobacteraceae bacterium]|jgi:hypothetical protein|nr:hypothetical protein [Solirubrobacteraceae bacterium]
MDWIVRHRAWIVMAVVLAAAVLATTLGKGTKRGFDRNGTDAARVSFGSQVRQLGATSDLIYTNGWVATSGKQTIGVYAGGQRFNRRNGLFVIMRQSGGGPKIARIVVRGSGAVTLLRPAPAATEQAAFGETLHFVAGNGATGTLDLSGDRLSLSG